MLGFNKKKQANAAKEAIRAAKIAESQNALLASAITTADAAQEVTFMLKSKLDEVIEQFNHTARILKDALVICDASGSITYFNPAAEALFGLSYKQALGKGVLGLFTGVSGAIQNTGELWVKLQNTNEDDVLGVRTDGSTFPARVGFSVLERNGGSNAILLLIRDRREERPCPEASRYAAIFETTFDGVVIAKDGVIVAANPSCIRLFGYQTNTLIGQPASMLVVDREKDRFLDVLLGEKSEQKNFLIDGIHESGRLLTLIFTVTEVEWDGGKASLTTIRDITEMKRLEKMISMKRDNGIDMVCSFDANFRITFVNQTFANSHSLRIKDILGADIRDFAPNKEEFEQAILMLSPESPSHRSHVMNNDEFQDWIDHGVFDDRGCVIEYHRVGRTLSDKLTSAIKGT